MIYIACCKVKQSNLAPRFEPCKVVPVVWCWSSFGVPKGFCAIDAACCLRCLSSILSILVFKMNREKKHNQGFYFDSNCLCVRADLT